MNAKLSLTDRVACWSCVQWTAAKTSIAALACLGAATWTGEGDWLLLAGFFGAFGVVAIGASLLVSAKTGPTCNMERGNDHAR